jgi:DNA-binding transcriptional LysR family regulator
VRTPRVSPIRCWLQFESSREIENAVDAIGREEQGRLAVGVMPAFAGPFIQQATLGLLRQKPNVFCSVQSLGSPWIVDGLVTRKLDDRPRTFFRVIGI